jgi:hypothetical protein
MYMSPSMKIVPLIVSSFCVDELSQEISPTAVLQV